MADMDWITSLARQAETVALPSKAARIAKRQAKMERQQQRKKSKLGGDQPRTAQSKEKQHTDKQRHARIIQQWRQDWQSVAELMTTRKYSPPVLTSDRQPRNYPHQVRHKKIPLASKLEPRRCDYGGLGLAQPSMYLAFTDPSWAARLEEDFCSHVQGWSGKPPMVQAVKKQRDANLLWRRLQKAKRDKGRVPDVQTMLESEELI